MADILASAASDLLVGANIPFVASFLLGVLFTVLSVLGLGQSDADHDLETEAAVDHDLDIDHDADFELNHDADLDTGPDHDVDADHDVDLDHGTDVGAADDHDLDHDVETEAGSTVTLNDILYFFGIGKVPLSILLMTFSYTFGLTGWLVNTAVAGPNGLVGSWFTASLGGALVAGLAAMRFVSSVIAKVMPTRNVSGFTRRQLVGMRGETGLPVDEHGGRAQVTDPEGTLHQVRCRTVPGGKPLPKGANIIVVKYLAADDLYYVAAERSGKHRL